MPIAKHKASQRQAEALAELIEFLGRRIHSAGFVEGLNPAQWCALRFLARANPSARTLTAFVRFHSGTMASASQTLGALRKKELVRQTESAEDRRIKYYMLTDKGTALLRHDPLRLLVAAISGLPRQQIAEVAVAIQSMLRAEAMNR